MERGANDLHMVRVTRIRCYGLGLGTVSLGFMIGVSWLIGLGLDDVVAGFAIAALLYSSPSLYCA